MRRSGLIVLGLMLLGMSSAGCQNKMYEENLGLHRQNRELQAENTRLKQEMGQKVDPSELAAMQQQNAQLNATIQDLQRQLQAPPPGQPADSGLAGIAVTRDEKAGTLTVDLPGDILFDSGKSELKPSAKTTLNKIVNAIKKDYAGKKVMVDGYTDTDPISRTKDQWKDNLDLSAARARSVVSYLTSEGLDSKLVKPRAFGDTAPKGSKPASRRVEIVVATR
jgi:flagellar motor protein MotB